jgi:AcrR family transcriptional regulator
MTTTKFSHLAPAQRREQILDAANALFAERGYDEVSIEDIASSAGVTRGLVHHYFGGRKEVYIALLERLGTLREEQLPPPVGHNARRPRPPGQRRVALQLGGEEPQLEDFFGVPDVNERDRERAVEDCSRLPF